jgi:hypothetical protein
MAGRSRSPLLARLALVAAFTAVALGGAASTPTATSAALSRWTGGIDLYRAGVFTTQKTWLWCTAADVQIMRNIVRGTTDHTKASQQRYFDYMRTHDRYDIPVSDGVDPAGWTAGLRHYVDSRYRLTASSSFDSALRSAVTNLRKTNLPVAITVSHGNHAWILTGFSATADPAVTSKFTVTSVRVTGPLWGLQSRTYGYDMRPDTKLTPAQLKTFFTPWHYAGVKMAWEGRWVSVQPVPVTAAPKATPTPRPATPRPTPTPGPTPSPAVTLAPEAVSATPPPSSPSSPSPPATASPSPALVAGLTGSGPVEGSSSVPDPAAAADRTGDTGSVGLALVLALIALGGGALALVARRHAGPARRT